MDVDNPWQVESIEAFYALKCPECTFYTKEEEIFFYHAFENHTMSNVFFGKSAKGKEFLAQKGIFDEAVNFGLKQTNNCDQELLLSETKHLKEKEMETEVMIQRHIAIMELPVDSSKSKYELLKELHKIGDVKNLELPKGEKRYFKCLGAPKPPLSGYTYFKIDRREGVREDSPGMSNKELYKKLATEWSQLGQEEKQKYDERADIDKKRYSNEFLEYQKTDNYKEFISQKKAAKNEIKDIKKRVKSYPKSTEAPKHPKGCYTHFLNDRREGVREGRSVKTALGH